MAVSPPAAAPKGRRMPRSGPNEYFEAGIDDYTVIHDLHRNTAIGRIRGLVFVPIGAEVELVNPNVNARVVRVRLLAGDPTTLCLDVMVPEGS